MSKLNVYLSGNVRNACEEFQTWRDKCMDYAQYYNNLKFIDPMNYFNYLDKKPKTDRQCLDLFMHIIEKSNILLVNLDLSCASIGTAMEVEHSFCNGIPIIGFGEDRKSWYNWVEQRCSVTFEDLEDAIFYISNTYGTV